MSIDKKISYLNQDGYNNYTKNSDSVTVPRKFKSKENATPTKLAYITADEAKMLKKIKKGTPHKGPSGVPSYDDYDASKGDYGTATTGEQMSGFESGAKGERSRADARSLSMSPTDVQDIRSGAIAAGAGQNVNPGFFGPRNRVSNQELARAKAFAPQAYRATRGSPFGLGNILGGIAGLVMGIPGLGFGINALRNFPGVKNFFSDEDDDMSKFNNLPLGGSAAFKNLDIRDKFNRNQGIVATNAFNNNLIADATYNQQKNMLENILNTKDTNLDKFIEDKELKEQRQQELLNQILTG